MKYRLAFLSIFAGLSLSACVTNTEVYIDESAISILPQDAAIEYLQGIAQDYRSEYATPCSIGEQVEYSNTNSGKYEGRHPYSDMAFAIYETFGTRTVIMWKSKDKAFTNKQLWGGDYCNLIFGVQKESLAQAINDNVFENTASALISLGATRVAATF